MLGQMTMKLTGLGVVALSVLVAPAAGQVAAATGSMVRFGAAEAPAKGEGVVRLCTYNVENLFDGLDDPAYSGRNEDLDDEKPLHELEAVARAIREADADILCLQEIESLEALTAFRDAHLEGMGYDHIASIDAGGPRGIEQAVLSRFPIVNAQNWPGLELGGVHPELYGSQQNWNAGKPLTFRRSPLRVDIEVPTGEGSSVWTVFVVHHKSGFGAAYWREAEAKGMVGLIETLQQDEPGRPIVVLGDFNAQISDASVKTYLDAGFESADGLASKPGDRFVTHESGRRIDHILVNEAASGHIQDGSGFVLGTQARPAGIDWRDLATFDGYAADHYPVCVDLVKDVSGVTP